MVYIRSMIGVLMQHTGRPRCDRGSCEPASRLFRYPFLRLLCFGNTGLAGWRQRALYRERLTRG
jgi:hypothetical protein